MTEKKSFWISGNKAQYVRRARARHTASRVVWRRPVRDTKKPWSGDRDMWTAGQIVHWAGQPVRGARPVA